MKKALILLLALQAGLYAMQVRGGGFARGGARGGGFARGGAVRGAPARGAAARGAAEAARGAKAGSVRGAAPSIRGFFRNITSDPFSSNMLRVNSIGEISNARGQIIGQLLRTGEIASKGTVLGRISAGQIVDSVGRQVAQLRGFTLGRTAMLTEDGRGITVPRSAWVEVLRVDETFSSRFVVRLANSGIIGRVPANSIVLATDAFSSEFRSSFSVQDPFAQNGFAAELFTKSGEPLVGHQVARTQDYEIELMGCQLQVAPWSRDGNSHEIGCFLRYSIRGEIYRGSFSRRIEEGQAVDSFGRRYDAVGSGLAIFATRPYSRPTNCWTSAIGITCDFVAHFPVSQPFDTYLREIFLNFGDGSDFNNHAVVFERVPVKGLGTESLIVPRELEGSYTTLLSHRFWNGRILVELVRFSPDWYRAQGEDSLFDLILWFQKPESDERCSIYASLEAKTRTRNGNQPTRAIDLDGPSTWGKGYQLRDTYPHHIMVRAETRYLYPTDLEAYRSITLSSHCSRMDQYLNYHSYPEETHRFDLTALFPEPQ